MFTKDFWQFIMQFEVTQFEAVWKTLYLKYALFLHFYLGVHFEPLLG